MSLEKESQRDLYGSYPGGLSRGMIESNLYFKKSVLNTHSPNGTEPEQPGREEKAGTWMR